MSLELLRKKALTDFHENFQVEKAEIRLEFSTQNSFGPPGASVLRQQDCQVMHPCISKKIKYIFPCINLAALTDPGGCDKCFHDSVTEWELVAGHVWSCYYRMLYRLYSQTVGQEAGERPSGKRSECLGGWQAEQSAL